MGAVKREGQIVTEHACASEHLADLAILQVFMGILMFVLLVVLVVALLIVVGITFL